MSREKPKRRDADRTDWARVENFTDADIERMAAQDIDNPASDEAHWAHAVVGLPPHKTRILASLDHDVVDWFRDQGPGYQTRMNAVLRHYMEQHRKVG